MIVCYLLGGSGGGASYASQLVAMWLGEGAAIIKRGEHGEEGGGEREVVADVQ